MNYPFMLFLWCVVLMGLFFFLGPKILNVASEISLIEEGGDAISVPFELLNKSDSLASMLSNWTLASFVLVGFALSGARMIDLSFADKVLAITFVSAVFFSLFFGYSAKAEVLDLLTWQVSSLDSLFDAFRAVKKILARQAFAVSLVGATAIYFAARGVMAATPISSGDTEVLPDNSAISCEPSHKKGGAQ